MKDHIITIRSKIACWMCSVIVSHASLILLLLLLPFLVITVTCLTDE